MNANSTSSAQRTPAHAAAKVGIAEIKDDLRDVRDDLTKLKDDAVGVASVAAHTAADHARQGLEVAEEYAKKAGDHVKDGYTAVCGFVKERPTTAILIAVGVGALVARLLSARR